MEESKEIKRPKVPHKKSYYYILGWCLVAVMSVTAAYAVTLLTSVTPVVAAASLSSPSCPSPTSLTANQSYFIAGFTQ